MGPTQRAKIIEAREREQKIEVFLLRGEKNQSRIAAALGVHRSVICKAERRIRIRWAKKSLKQRDRLLEERLSQLDMIIFKSLDAFDRSQKSKTETVTSQKPVKCPSCYGKKTVGGEECPQCHGAGKVLTEVVSMKVTGLIGEPQFLRIAKDAMIEKSKLEGLHVERKEIDIHVRAMMVAMDASGQDDMMRDVVEKSLELRRRTLNALSDN